MAGDRSWGRLGTELREALAESDRLALAGWIFAGLGVFVFVAPLIGPYVGMKMTRHWGLRLYASGAGVLIALAGYGLLRLTRSWPFRKSSEERRRRRGE